MQSRSRQPPERGENRRTARRRGPTWRRLSGVCLARPDHSGSRTRKTRDDVVSPGRKVGGKKSMVERKQPFAEEKRDLARGIGRRTARRALLLGGPARRRIGWLHPMWAAALRACSFRLAVPIADLKRRRDQALTTSSRGGLVASR